MLTTNVVEGGPKSFSVSNLVESLMAKHIRRGRRRRKRYLQIQDSMVVGALVAGDVVSEDLSDTVDDKVFALWFKGTVALSGNTAGEGPLQVGLAHSDYSSAEIEEALEAVGNWDEGDLVAREQGARRVRRIGQFLGLDAVEVLNDGKPLFQKMMFSLENGITLKTWARNNTGATRTTGGNVRFDGILCVTLA